MNKRPDILTASIATSVRCDDAAHTPEPTPSFPLPFWAPAIQDEIEATLSDPAFPCVFAREAMMRGAIQFCWAGSSDEQADRTAIADSLKAYLEYCTSLPPLESLLETLAVVFKPITPALSLQQYHQQAWDILQDLHDHDSQPWPADIPSDPDNPLWSFCFAGTPVFVNVSAPGHVARRSRNLCRSLVLVMQPRSNFDLVAGKDHPNGEQVREQIRKRMAMYDQVDSPSELGTYGDSANREWHQYVLRESNDPPTGKCPLSIRKG